MSDTTKRTEDLSQASQTPPHSDTKDNREIDPRKVDLTDEIVGLVRAISSDDNAKFFPDGYVNKILATVSRYYAPKTAQSHLLDTLLEAIGEDEPDILVRENGDGSQVVQINPCNKLRQKLRTIIKEMQK